MYISQAAGAGNAAVVGAGGVEAMAEAAAVKTESGAGNASDLSLVFDGANSACGQAGARARLRARAYVRSHTHMRARTRARARHTHTHTHTHTGLDDVDGDDVGDLAGW